MFTMHFDSNGKSGKDQQVGGGGEGRDSEKQINLSANWIVAAGWGQSKRNQSDAD